VGLLSGSVSLHSGPAGFPGRPFPHPGPEPSERAARSGFLQRSRNLAPERSRARQSFGIASGSGCDRLRSGTSGEVLRQNLSPPGGAGKLPMGQPPRPLSPGSPPANPQGLQASFRVAGTPHHPRRSPQLDPRRKRPVPNARAAQTGPHPGKAAPERL